MEGSEFLDALEDEYGDIRDGARQFAKHGHLLNKAGREQFDRAVKAEAELATLRDQLRALPRYYLRRTSNDWHEMLAEHRDGDWVKVADLDALMGPQA